ncbi:MAG: phosphatidate cytidylyltransferase [Chromatiales bacterium]|jgi:phosphatidate cytidylyltransferase|nr:MAG: phosphatidate cytidylyltransferase [Chromatiales bacterium]
MSQLRQRVLTAVPLLIGLLLLLFAAPVWVVIAVSTVLMLLGAWEWSAFVGWQLPLARGGYVAAVAVLMAGIAWLVPGKVGLPVVLWIALLWWLFAFFWILRFPIPVPPGIAAIAGLFVLVPAWLSMIAILRVPQQGPGLLLLALCIVFAADVGAYFTGRRFGRIKLAPRVSPGKTWEGLIGGVLFAGLVAAGGSTVLGLPIAFMAPIGLGIAALSVVGDLTVSMFKRSVGLKDSGQLIPGHGGVLDRLDSVTAALPTFALALSWLGVLPG